MPSLVHECAYKNSDSAVRIHFHNAYELLFVRNGRLRLEIDGKVYQGERGSAFIIGRFEEHAIERVSGDYERYFVIIDPTRIEQLITERRLLAPLRNRPKGFSHLFDAFFFDRFEILFRRLVEEYTTRPGEFAELMQMSLLTELLILLRRTAPWDAGETKPARSSVLAVQSYIESHFHEQLSISNLAARVFMTPSYLTHCFKDATGYSPKQYLVQNRLACAKDLLASTALPVAEVALRAGFTDVNNFIRTFRKETSLTPLRYREQQQI